MEELSLDATPLLRGLLLASLFAFVVGIILLFARRKRTGRFSWSGFVLVMFVSVLFFDLGVYELTGRVESVMLSVFHSLQTLIAERDAVVPTVNGISEGQSRVLTLYGTLLFILAPVSIITAALDYFSGVMTGLHLRLKSLFAESYIFSRLDERTLSLAQDVKDHYQETKGLLSRRVCIVFSRCDDANEELLEAAHRMGATCLEDDVETASFKCLRHLTRSIVLLEDDEETAITTARVIKEKIRKRHPLFRGGKTNIFVLTDFRHTESLLFPELLSEEEAWENTQKWGKILVRGIDLTRELVEEVMLRNPLFLLSKASNNSSVSEDDRDAIPEVEAIPDTCWYQANESEIAGCRNRELYTRPDRHVLVVGAGSIGREFLSSALWASRVDGIHTKIDVIDKAVDPLKPGRSYPESRFESEAPEIMKYVATARSDSDNHIDDSDLINGETPYDLTFSLVNAETAEYARYLSERAGTLSYVFIALGDDLLDARVAMHTRQILERELAKRSSSRDEFLRASRPIVVTVIRNDDFKITVERAINEGQPYDIVCMGNNSEVLTYGMLNDLVSDNRHFTEYKRRSNRASNTHLKYRLFAFAHHLLTGQHGIREALENGITDETVSILCKTFDMEIEDPAIRKMRATVNHGLDQDTVLEVLKEVDWTIDVSDSSLFNRIKNWTLVLLYQLYCTNGVTRALDSMTDDKPSREWLLSMEHDRWNAYIRTQGFVQADFDTTQNIFATGQVDKQKHRSNLMGLHPCLVSFEELAELDKPIYGLYDAYFRELDQREINSDDHREIRQTVAERDWLQILDDNYIGFRRPVYD